MPTTTANLNTMQTSGSSAPLLSEILTKVNNAKMKDDKIKVLRDNDSVPLRQILKGNFDPKVVWDLPDGTPPFKRNEAPAGTEHTLLSNEARRLWHFVKGADPKLSKTKKEMMFIQMLEGLHPQEAEILCLVKDKSLSTKYKITQATVSEAFPDIQWGGRS